MNFFEAQDKARRQTTLLVVLFLAAVFALVPLLYLVAHFITLNTKPTLDNIDYKLMTDVGVGVAALVTLGTLSKVVALSWGGGATVAEQMGGKLLTAANASPKEKQLLNIVSEMALAAGCPVPPVYLIPDDNINAFAAGTNIGNAVVGVTRGALNSFSRDEMQGVVAHEFSHIMNGDMRINIRLIGVIYGIMMLSYLGYWMFRSAYYTFGSRNPTMAALPLVGLALMVAGSSGAFFGGLIRSAVSRQREYLADASAVQYTRNPEGIGGALKKIGAKYGLLRNKNATEYAHLFFAQGVTLSFANMFASHPPIEERISRVLPNWDGKMPTAKPEQTPEHTPQSPTGASAFAGGAAMSGFSSGASPQDTPQQSLPDLYSAIFGGSESATEAMSRAGTVGNFTAAEGALAALPEKLRNAFTDPYSARALAYAMLLDERDDTCRRAQCGYLQNFADTGVYDLTLSLAPEVSRLPHAARLPLLLQAMPALRMLSPEQYERFSHNLEILIAADEKMDVLEWSISAALSHYLSDCFGVSKKRKLPTSANAISYALSMMAKAGHGTEAKKAFTAGAPQSQFRDETFKPSLLEDAMRRLSRASPKIKRRFLESAAKIAAHDGQINPDEGVLLRAYAALLDCPLPPVLGDANTSARADGV